MEEDSWGLLSKKERDRDAHRASETEMTKGKRETESLAEERGKKMRKKSRV